MDEPTYSLTVSPCVVPSSMIQHAVLCWAATAGCVLISAPTAATSVVGPSDYWRARSISPRSDRRVGVCRRCSRLGGRIPPAPRWCPRASPCSTSDTCLWSTWLAAMARRHSPGITRSTCSLSQTCTQFRDTSVTSGRQVLPLVGEADLETGDIFAVAHAPLMSVALDALQHDRRALCPPPWPMCGVSPVSTVPASPLAAVTAPASTSPALLERSTSEQRTSFLRVWARLPSHLRAVAFDLYGSDWTLSAIEQLGGIHCKFPHAFREFNPGR